MSDQHNTVSVELPNVNSLAKERRIPFASFGVIILLFFLPFLEIKCSSGQSLVNATGMNLVFGKSIESPGGGIFGPTEDTSSQKMKTNIWALLALLAAVGGLAVYAIAHKEEAKFGTVAGGVGFVALFLLMLTAKTAVTKGAASGAEGDMSAMAAQIKVVFKFAYWLALLLFIVAGGMSYLRWRQK